MITEKGNHIKASFKILSFFMAQQYLNKKKSLSILSGSTVNKLNNAQSAFPQKPLKERVISESTGLIKLSLTKPKAEHKPDSKQGLPIFIPVEEEEELQELEPVEEQPEQEQELLFKLATKQRRVMDLKEQLTAAESDLSHLEAQYKQKVSNDMVTDKPDARMFKAPAKKQSLLEIGQQLGKKASQIQIGKRPSLSFMKPEPKFVESLNSITENISDNLAHNELLIKGRNIFANLNRENERWRGMQAHALRERLDKSQIKASNPKLSNTLNKIIHNVLEPAETEVAPIDTDEEDYTCSFEYSECPCTEEEKQFRSKIQGTIFFPSDDEE